ncbi:MAG: HD domain-containing phosphohydrolase [Candidatus Sedimenticola sp. 6PFRAG5]
MNDQMDTDVTVNEVRANIAGLRVGMYVSRLDQSWLETPFAFQGIRIKSEVDIQRLKEHTRYVYIDTNRGPAPSPMYISPEKPASFTDTEESSETQDYSVSVDPHEIKKLNRQTYEDKKPLEKEIRSADRVYKKVQRELERVVTDLEKQKDLDLIVVKDGISDMVNSIINNQSAMMWMAQMKKLDDYTYTRALSTSVWCATFGRHLGMEKTHIQTLALGGLLLDLGKSSLPVELLKNRGKLSPEQKKQMDEHVNLGVKVLAKAATATRNSDHMELLQMIATHHERSDGSGYPQQLDNDDIPLYGKIAGIADSFDAMTSHRPYVETGAMSPHAAITELYALRGKKFPPDLIESFIQTIGIYPIGSLVELSTGEVGAVVSISKNQRLRPSIMLFLDAEKKSVSPLHQVDLSKMENDIFISRGLPAGAYDIGIEEVLIQY